MKKITVLFSLLIVLAFSGCVSKNYNLQGNSVDYADAQSMEGKLANDVKAVYGTPANVSKDFIAYS